jgi:hypothetical protein
MSVTTRDLKTSHILDKAIMETRKNFLVSFCTQWKQHTQSELCKIPNITPVQIEHQCALENAYLHDFYLRMVNALSQEDEVMQMRHRIEDLEFKQNLETMTDS